MRFGRADPRRPPRIDRVALVVQVGADITVIETGDGAGETEVVLDLQQDEPDELLLRDPARLWSTPPSVLRMSAVTRFGRGSDVRYLVRHWMGGWPDLGDPRCGARREEMRCERWQGHVEAGQPDHVAGNAVWGDAGAATPLA